MGANINLEIAKQAAEIKQNDMTGTLTIEAAVLQAQRNLNKLQGLSGVIKALRGEEDD
ncbi:MULTISPECIES: hypothetical protein [unclassified Clostridium]|uniref:hypothetical protein n=1 Tax=unclassified Clostridium TaxID=2614128 RepID=UPI000297293F|nr:MULTISPECIES: hypothetical protein [unclassified Clostridium]EKQ56313.1 MAG: hypothetical protein A370_02069 [Clostridium sp. Maddingley MBC34-26]